MFTLVHRTAMLYSWRTLLYNDATNANIYAYTIIGTGYMNDLNCWDVEPLPIILLYHLTSPVAQNKMKSGDIL